MAQALVPSAPFQKFENDFDCMRYDECGYWYGRICQEMEVHPEIGQGAVCKPEGEPYATIAWQANGYYAERVSYGTAIFDNLYLAWALWTHAFDRYRADQGGNRLYWRKEPEFVKCTEAPARGFVHARLYISKGD